MADLPIGECSARPPGWARIETAWAWLKILIASAAPGPRAGRGLKHLSG